VRDRAINIPVFWKVFFGFSEKFLEKAEIAEKLKSLPQRRRDAEQTFLRGNSSCRSGSFRRGELNKKRKKTFSEEGLSGREDAWFSLCASESLRQAFQFSAISATSRERSHFMI
jgi:hypothetical protein